MLACVCIQRDISFKLQNKCSIVHLTWDGIFACQFSSVLPVFGAVCCFFSPSGGTYNIDLALEGGLRGGEINSID